MELFIAIIYIIVFNASAIKAFDNFNRKKKMQGVGCLALGVAALIVMCVLIHRLDAFNVKLF